LSFFQQSRRLAESAPVRQPTSGRQKRGTPESNLTEQALSVPRGSANLCSRCTCGWRNRPSCRHGRVIRPCGGVGGADGCWFWADVRLVVPPPPNEVQPRSYRETSAAPFRFRGPGGANLCSRCTCGWRNRPSCRHGRVIRPCGGVGCADGCWFWADVRVVVPPPPNEVQPRSYRETSAAPGRFRGPGARGDRTRTRAIPSRRSVIPGGHRPLWRWLVQLLPRGDGDIADFIALGRGDNLGGVQVGELADGGRREIVALLGPGTV